MVNKPLSGQINKRRKRKNKSKKTEKIDEDRHPENKMPTGTWRDDKTGMLSAAPKKTSIDAGSYYAVSNVPDSVSESGSKTGVVRSHNSSSNHGDPKSEYSWYYGTSRASDGVKRPASSQHNKLRYNSAQTKLNSPSNHPHNCATQSELNSTSNHSHHYATLNKSNSTSNHHHTSQYPSTSRSYAYSKDYRIQTYANGERRVTAPYQAPQEHPAARRRRRNNRGRNTQPFQHQIGQYQPAPMPLGPYESLNPRLRVPTKMMGRLSIVEQLDHHQGIAAERYAYHYMFLRLLDQVYARDFSSRKSENSSNQQKRPHGTQNVKISNSCVSPAEHALTRFLAIWNGLTKKLFDK